MQNQERREIIKFLFKLLFSLLVTFLVFSAAGQSGALYCRICHQFFSDESSYLAHMRTEHGVGSSGNNRGGYSGPSAAQIAAQRAAAAQQQADADQRAREEQAEREEEARAAAARAKHEAEVLRQFQQSKREGLNELRGLSEGGDFDSGLKGVGSTDLGLKTLPDVNTDPNVVDGRKVPSGLPKSVDDAIAAGYSSAPPGVSDNVRKGFQAIAAHDWNLAKAWFGTALNHDPANAGLKRLVELADYTEKRIQEGKAGKSTNSSSADRPMQLPKDSDIYFLFPGLREIEAQEINDYVREQVLKDTMKLPDGSNPAK